VDWNSLAQDRDQGQTVVNMVMRHGFHEGQAPTGTLLCGVNAR
jgi:hypothetical protein